MTPPRHRRGHPPRRGRSPATSARTSWSSRASATSATSRIARPTCRRRSARYGKLGVDVENGFDPLYVVDAGQEARRLRSEGETARRGRVAARDGRGPGGRGDRLAPARGAPAESRCGGWCSTRSRRTSTSCALDQTRGHRRAPGRRTGDPTDPRPAVRVRGLAGALEEGDAAAVGGARPVRRHAARRRAGVDRWRFVAAGYWDILGT